MEATSWLSWRSSSSERRRSASSDNCLVSEARCSTCASRPTRMLKPKTLNSSPLVGVFVLRKA